MIFNDDFSARLQQRLNFLRSWRDARISLLGQFKEFRVMHRAVFC